MKLINSECLEAMKQLPENSVDAVITDPPYGLSFMGKKWDYDVPSVDIWEEALRVLKPGGYLLSFAGTRTQHRMAVRIEDAGFEIRDMIAWVYGSGFPKSLNIGKQEGCEEWEGWGTALKPALEPITMARKPLSEKTVAENCLKWGVCGIDVDGSRVEGKIPVVPQPKFGIKDPEIYGFATGEGRNGEMSRSEGRFPANLIHDGSDEVKECFPESKGCTMSTPQENTGNSWKNTSKVVNWTAYNDNGNASRFFKSIIYQAKASKSERNDGCDKNNHPTVKPVALMEYLIKMVTKEGYTVLDPFMGSGTTGIACKNTNRDFIGIEMDAGYFEIASKRIG